MHNQFVDLAPAPLLFPKGHHCRTRQQKDVSPLGLGQDATEALVVGPSFASDSRVEGLGFCCQLVKVLELVTETLCLWRRPLVQPKGHYLDDV